jgi:hypothetical protein
LDFDASMLITKKNIAAIKRHNIVADFYSLFDEAVSYVRRMLLWLMNAELGKNWNGMVIA